MFNKFTKIITLKKYFLLFLINLFAIKSFSEKIYKREEKFSFPTNFLDTLNIIANNCKINVSNSMKHEINIEIIYEVFTKKEKKSDQFLSAIKCYVTKNNGKIYITQTVDNYKLDFSFKSGKSYYNVTYNISMPIYLIINAQIKHGEITIDKLNNWSYFKLNNSTINIKEMECENIQKPSVFNIEYTKLKILRLDNCIIIADNSSLDIYEAKILEINSTYTDITINNCQKLNLRSYGDNVNVSNLLELSLNSKYSKLGFYNFKGNGTLNLKFSSCILQNIDIINTYIDLDNSKLQILLNEKSCFKIQSIARFSELDFTKKANINNYISPNKIQTDGFIGCNNKTDNKLIINSDFSQIRIHFMK